MERRLNSSAWAKTSPPDGAAAGRQSNLAAIEGGEISVREALPGDTEALEVVHADVAQYYDQGAPHLADRPSAAEGQALRLVAEEWGRRAGATVAETTTFQSSPLSVPFWEDRMGYEELATSLEKRL